MLDGQDGNFIVASSPQDNKTKLILTKRDLDPILEPLDVIVAIM